MLKMPWLVAIPAMAILCVVILEYKDAMYAEICFTLPMLMARPAINIPIVLIVYS
ncbi:hypothetical protein BH09BAC1_BH09BAC1_27810 [soil metagenome]